ncbi:hypothetical protein NQ317_007455, partial [Molorchus minor]
PTICCKQKKRFRILLRMILQRVLEKLHVRYVSNTNGNLMLTTTLFVVFKYIIFYYISLISFIIYNIALFIKGGFCTLKSYILQSLTPELSGNIFTLYEPTGANTVHPIFISGDKTIMLRLMEASKGLNILFECLDIFNYIFGTVLLLMNFSTVIAILAALNTLLITGETNILTMEILINCLSEALFLFKLQGTYEIAKAGGNLKGDHESELTYSVINSYIISACGVLKQEPELIVKLCCKLQHLLPKSSQERKELLHMANQINRKSAIVSAFGFFDVDFPLIFNIFSYVGAYTVILIQFSYIDF